ncbi:MAG: hypothetical protein IPK03_02540 [Bacteroidetes bacterium]|nr:hypothetical protein [Bacteroidota bacterium]
MKQFKAVAMLFYSDLLEMEDKLEESIKVMQDSYALATKSPKLTKEIYAKLAYRYKKMGDFEKPYSIQRN